MFLVVRAKVWNAGICFVATTIAALASFRLYSTRCTTSAKARDHCTTVKASTTDLNSQYRLLMGFLFSVE